MSVPAELVLGAQPSGRETGLWIGAAILIVAAHAAFGYLLRDLAPFTPPPEADQQAMVVDLAPLPISVPDAVQSQAVPAEEIPDMVQPLEELTEAEPVEPDPEVADLPPPAEPVQPDQAEPQTDAVEAVQPAPDTLEEAQPDQTVQAEPEQVQPDQAVPDQIQPDEAEPLQAETEQAEPVEAEPEPVEQAQAETVEQDTAQPEPELVVPEIADTVTPEVMMPLPEPRPEAEPAETKPEPVPRKTVTKPTPKKETAKPRREKPRQQAKTDDAGEGKPQPQKPRPSSQSSKASTAPTVNPNRWNSAVRSAVARAANRVRGMRGSVSISFTVGASGGVTSARVSRSSGDPRLDSAALGAVRSARAPAPPAGLGGSRAFNIPLTFD